MGFSWVSSDLFSNAYHVQAFAHGCNCAGSMGALADAEDVRWIATPLRGVGYGGLS